MRSPHGGVAAGDGRLRAQLPKTLIGLLGLRVGQGMKVRATERRVTLSQRWVPAPRMSQCSANEMAPDQASCGAGNGLCDGRGLRATVAGRLWNKRSALV